MTGKVRFGETLEEAASRELYEETGLTTNTLILEEIYRKMRKRKDGKWVQDVLFYIFFAKEFSDKLIKKTHVQENFWMTKKEFEDRKNDGLDPYKDLVVEDRVTLKKLSLRENRHHKGFLNTTTTFKGSAQFFSFGRDLRKS